MNNTTDQNELIDHFISIYPLAVLFEVVHNDHDRIRGQKILGRCSELPTVGKLFVMVAPPIEPHTTGRHINTNVVTEVEAVDNSYLFKTASGSQYRCSLLEEIKLTEAGANLIAETLEQQVPINAELRAAASRYFLNKGQQNESNDRAKT